jgi:CBS domain-containing protein
MKSLAQCFDDEPTEVRDRVGDLVRAPALTVAPATPLGQVRRLLVHHRVPAIAVIDGEGSVRGIVTRTDVLRQMSAADATADDAMSSFVFTMPATASIDKAAALIATEGVGQVLVVDLEQRLLGMVSAVDLARYYAALAGHRVA